jgi:hypothetical protein
MFCEQIASDALCKTLKKSCGVEWWNQHMSLPFLSRKLRRIFQSYHLSTLLNFQASGSYLTQHISLFIINLNVLKGAFFAILILKELLGNYCTSFSSTGGDLLMNV